jgi:hypothetical protein
LTWIKNLAFYGAMMGAANLGAGASKSAFQVGDYFWEGLRCWLIELQGGKETPLTHSLVDGFEYGSREWPIGRVPRVKTGEDDG